ncbi:MAG: chorismate synthase [Nitrospinota bacterium]
MAGNCFGVLFKIMTWGESHGPALGVVIDGCPAGIAITEEDIQYHLDRRKPGQSKITTPRSEADKVEILSGVFEGVTTGVPISLLVRNQDARPGHYSDIKDIYRPGHADFTYESKYGVRDYRGGGRSSGRETIGRVAAGAVARKVLKRFGIEVVGYTKRVGNISAETFNEAMIEKNDVRCPDPAKASEIVALIQKVRKAGDSVGGSVEVLAKNVPVGLGEPVFDKLDGDIAKALMSIGAVKGVEIGDGGQCSFRTGGENNDTLIFEKGKIGFKTNGAGGILGGISNGQTICARVCIKPTPSIAKKQVTVDKKGERREIQIRGRHDPCLCPRIVPVAESMVALVLLDHLLRQRATSALN